MKNIILLISVLFSVTSFAQEKFPEYKLGQGAHYSMMVDGQPAQVKMAFVKRTDDLLVVEMDMTMTAGEVGMPIHMVQQFHLTMEAGKIKIAKGFMKIPNIPKPQRLPPEFLKGYDGAQMKSFLVGSQGEIDSMKVGKEKVPTTEGVFDSTHYRRTSNGQTVEFWVTEDPKLKPLSIVQMKSKGSKREHNYTLRLKGLVKGYKSQINPDDSEPLNAMGRMFLPMLTNSSMFLN